MTIIFLIIATVLKTIQKVNNDPNYLQDKVRDPNKLSLDPISSFFYYYLDTVGINSFFDSDNVFA
jgi:hypothetical protein